MKHQRAFTLVEILMVVVILGIVAAIIVPQIGARDDLRAASAARAVIADLSYAQSRAIALQKTQFARFESQQYTLLSRTGTSGPLTAITHPVNPGSYVTSFNVGPLAGVTLPDYTFGTASMLAFDDLGSPLQYDEATDTLAPLAAQGVIHVQSGTKTLTISVEPYTGELTVSE